MEDSSLHRRNGYKSITPQAIVAGRGEDRGGREGDANGERKPFRSSREKVTPPRGVDEEEEEDMNGPSPTPSLSQ